MAAAAILAAVFVGVARPAESATSTQTGSVSVSGDRTQSFPVNATRGATLKGTLDWTGTAELRLRLKDPSGNVVAESTTGRPRVVQFMANVAGKWHLAVWAMSGSASFTLVIDDGAAPPTTTTTSATTTTTAGGGGGAAGWPMFHRDITHSGLATGGPSATNAAHVGLDWQVNTGAGIFSSPAVVFNKTLGRTLVYVGNKVGTLGAYDAANGQRVWTFDIKGAAGIQSSPAVVNGVVYFGSTDHNLYAVDATTGAKLCSYTLGGVINASPLVVNPDGHGLVVYVGENGATGQDDGGTMNAINAVDPNSAVDCSLKWTFSSWGEPPGSGQGGSWSPPAFARTAAGRAVVVVGASSPDNSFYEFDAITGARIWRFQTETFFPDQDVGAGPTVAVPGTPGFPDGAVFVAGKSQIFYAANLLTGAKIWEYRIRDDSPNAAAGTRSTAAIADGRIYVGYGGGVYALNERTGAKIWKTEQTGLPAAEVVSSPAVSGPASARLITFGDTNGTLHGVDANGHQLWHYDTGTIVYGSPAVNEGRIFFGSGNGSLYSFTAGIQNSAKPDTVISSPAPGALANTGTLAISGTATDDLDVNRVAVAIRDQHSGLWFDGTAWTVQFNELDATLASPDAATTSWTYNLAVPPSGGPFHVEATAIDDEGQRDPTKATVDVTVASLVNPPDTGITSPTQGQVTPFPNGRAVFNFVVTGTAADTAGTTPGVASVQVQIQNLEHTEYFCGAPGCAPGGGESTAWTPVASWVPAQLGSPNATSTTWQLVFPTYDHPHNYMVTAYAVDRDGNEDRTDAVVARFCVVDAGVTAC